MEDEGKAAGSNSLTQPGSSTSDDGPIREDQVRNAAQFLVNPRVLRASMEERKDFLVKKGLSNKGMHGSSASLSFVER
jgi:hypothetical protein